MKRICIFGDSWCRGEWGWKNGKFGRLHKGLEQYLKDSDYQVSNFGEGGASNIEQFNRIITEDITNYDVILYFQTDPLRDYRSTKFKGMFESIEVFRQYQTTARHNHYSRLNSLGLKIYLLGGCDKIDENDLVEYKNLKCFVPSIIKLINEDLEHPNIWASDWIEYVDRNCNPELFNLIHEQKMIQDRFYSDEKLYVEYFQPDGKHPNRKAHYKIYEKVLKELLL
jgi:hypothetical protein